MSAPARVELVALLRSRSFRRGQFTLASGRQSPYYVDARPTTMSARGLSLIGTLGLAAIRDARDAVLSDPELGLPDEPETPGLPLAVGMRVRVKAMGVSGEVTALHGDEAELRAIPSDDAYRVELRLPVKHGASSGASS